jgi:hypothetical protein
MNMQTELAKLESFDVKALGDGTTLELRGWACTYDTIDLEGDTFDRATTEAAFRKFMETSGQVVVQHHLSAPIGKITEAIYKPTGIEVVVLVPQPSPSAPSVLQETWELIAAGAISTFSVGGKWAKLAAAGSRKLFPEILQELSVTLFGGVNPDAVFSITGTKALTLDGELERLDALDPSSLDSALAKLNEF